MSFLDRVNACNDLDLGNHRPFRVGGKQLGWIAPKHAEVLAKHGDVFALKDDAVGFVPALTTPDARSKAVAKIAPALSATGLYPKLRNELYAVKSHWSEPASFNIDRALIAGFGFRAYGVHINGFVRRGEDIHLWIGTRATDREVAPGKLDNMVAGGQPANLSLMDNVVKECHEEAGLTEALARSARPVGCLSYAFTSDQPPGTRVDTLFCYDLDMSTDVVPQNTDGEITGFELMPLDSVLDIVRTSDRFKFNVSLVVLDFAIRHGRLDPDTEPAVEAILAGLHRRPLPI